MDNENPDRREQSPRRRAWLSHIPNVPPDELPRAPATFTFESRPEAYPDHVPGSVRNSPSWNLWMLQKHPAYGPQIGGQYQNSGLAAELDHGNLSNATGRQIPPPPEEPSSAGRIPIDPSLLPPMTRTNGFQRLAPRPVPNAFHDPLSDHGEQRGILRPSQYSNHNDSMLPESFVDDLAEAVYPPPARGTFEHVDRPMLFPQSRLNDLRSNNRQLFDTETEDSSEDDFVPLEDGNHSQSDTRRRGRPRKNDSEPRRKRRRGRIKGTQVGPRLPMKPTEAFTETFNAATDTFLDEQDYDKAQTLVLQAIGMNPEIFAAHSLLADIYFAKNQPAEAVDALIMGLHGHNNDVELWRKVADTILDNEHESHNKKIERAAYCFSAIIRKEPKDLDARYQRAQCYKQLEMWNKAFGDLDIMLRQEPHNSNVLSAVAELCRCIGDLTKARIVYDEHFDHFKQTGISVESSFTWEDIGVYSELVADIRGVASGVAVFKEYARWLSGRVHETYWDRYPDDDREFDQTAYPRRATVQEFVDDPSPEEAYGLAVPLDIRGKLGILRLRQNLVEEAQVHFSWFDPQARDEDAPIHEYGDSFYDIAKALYAVREYEQALLFYEALFEEGWDLGVDFWMDLASCSAICGKPDEAIKFYKKVIDIEPKAVDARTQLSKLFRDAGDRETALKYGREAVLLAQEHLVISGDRRRYEKRDQRIVREDAERTLKSAFRMPLGNSSRKGKVPKELKYRTRKSRKLTLYAADLEMEEQIQPRVRKRYDKDNNTRIGRDKHGPEMQTSEEESGESSPGRPAHARVGASGKSKRTRPPRPSKDNPIRHTEEIQGIYQTMLNHEEAMRDGDEIATTAWLDCASTLIDDFRGVKGFYPTDRTKLFEGYGNTHTEPSPTPEEPIQARSTGPGSRAVSAFDADHNTQPQSMLRPHSVPTTYCEISFDTWLDIFLEYALVLATAQPGDTFQRDCYSTIQAALDCTIFYHDPNDVLLIQIAYLSCALALNDEPTIFNTCLRWFMNKFVFCTDTYRLFMAVNFLHEREPRNGGKQALVDNAAYNTGPNQKFIFRQVLNVDTHLPDNYNITGPEGGVPAFMREQRTGIRKLAADPTPGSTPGPDQSMFASVRPQEMDVVLLTLYGHILMSSNSFPNALSYLYRAYTIDADNPIVLLSMALCYMHQLFKRQIERRHQYVLMGWAWFGEYERARLKWAETYTAPDRDGGTVEQEREEFLKVVRREIEFNRARCWEMFGIGDLAIRGYERVLGLPGATVTDGEDEPEEDWTMEAAYAMQLIYAINGDAGKAMQIAEKHLVID